MERELDRMKMIGRLGQRPQSRVVAFAAPLTRRSTAS
jgi:hypothetical protein